MNSEKIHFFEKNLLFIVQSNNGKTVSFRLDTTKLIHLLVLSVVGVLFLSTGTLLFFRERANNQALSEKLLVSQVAPPTTTTVKSMEAVVPKSSAKTRIQEFSGNCHPESCTANLVLTAQENSLAEGSLIILLETHSPQIGSGNPSAKSRQKYYAYPEQKINENLNAEEIFKLESKPFHISRSLYSRANFTIGQFQRPIAFHLYLFDTNHELIKHEIIQVMAEDKNDP